MNPVSNAFVCHSDGINQSWGRTGGGGIVLPTLWCHSWRSHLVSLHAGWQEGLPVLNLILSVGRVADVASACWRFNWNNQGIVIVIITVSNWHQDGICVSCNSGSPGIGEAPLCCHQLWWQIWQLKLTSCGILWFLRLAIPANHLMLSYSLKCSSGIQEQMNLFYIDSCGKNGSDVLAFCFMNGLQEWVGFSNGDSTVVHIMWIGILGYAHLSIQPNWLKPFADAQNLHQLLLWIWLAPTLPVVPHHYVST